MLWWHFGDLLFQGAEQGAILKKESQDPVNCPASAVLLWSVDHTTSYHRPAVLRHFLLFLAMLATQLSLLLSAKQFSLHFLWTCSEVWHHSVSGPSKLLLAFFNVSWTVLSLDWRSGWTAAGMPVFWEELYDGSFLGDLNCILFVSVSFASSVWHWWRELCEILCIIGWVVYFL